MNKILLLMKSNFKKSNGQTIAIGIFVLIAVMLLNIWLLLNFDYTANFDRVREKENSSDACLLYINVDETFKNNTKNIIINDEETKDYEITDCLSIFASINYKDKTFSTRYMFIDKETSINKRIDRYEILSGKDNKSGVYLPYIYQVDAKYEIGDTIGFEFNGNRIEETVIGFYNSAMLGSQNCSITSILCTTDIYNKLSTNLADQNGYLFSMKIKNIDNAEKYKNRIANKVLEMYPSIMTNGTYFQLVKQARYITEMISSAIISAVAFTIIIIMVVVIASNISNYIFENMKNLGALKAIGYTSYNIILSLILLFASGTIISSIIGIGLSYLVMPLLNNLLNCQTGIPYTVRFLILPSALSILIVLFSVILITFISTRKIIKIDPIVAMRSGINNHNFKKNYLPLNKSILNRNVLIGIKYSFHNIAQNITIFVTMIVLAFLGGMSMVFIHNCIIDSSKMISMIVGAPTDSEISLSADNEDKLLNYLDNDARVERYYYYNCEEAYCNEETIYLNIIDNPYILKNDKLTYEGRLPLYDNEIVIGGKYAKENGYKIGDSITVNGAKEETYLIVGFDQITNSLGKDFIILKSGALKVLELHSASYHIDLYENEDINKFNSDLTILFDGDITTTNYKEAVDTGSSAYLSMVSAISFVIIGITIIVIIFILYLLIKSLINKTMVDLGILKSLGYTSSDLQVQMSFNLLPLSIISIIIGSILAMLFVNPMLTIFLSSIGILKSMFVIPYFLIILFSIFMMVFTFIMMIVLSNRIRKINPHNLLIGE